MDVMGTAQEALTDDRRLRSRQRRRKGMSNAACDVKALLLYIFDA